MMPAWIKSEQFAIQHVGQSGQWVPATDILGKKPDNIVEGKSGGDMLIFTNVLIVVIIHEIETAHLPKGRQCNCR